MFVAFSASTGPSTNGSSWSYWGSEIDAGRWLPADTYLGNFDNLSAAQGLSTTLLEAYLRAATEVSRIAVGNPEAPAVSAKYTNPIEISQHAWDHLDGTPYGTRGGMVVTHNFPVDGEYVFTFDMLFGGGTGDQNLDVSVNGTGVAQLRLENGRQTNVPVKTEPIFVQAGQRQIAAAFIRRIEGPYEDRLSPFDWSFVGGEDAIQWANYGITALPHVADVMVTGPLNPLSVSQTPSRARVFSCHPDAAQVSGPHGAVDPVSPGGERACAESIVRRIATEAYRRPVTDEDVRGPMSFYDAGLAEGGFEVGVRTALQAILASPSFLFRLEELPADVQPGMSYRLKDSDLAARLAFFLWGTGPDRELIEVAAQGDLTDDRVLEEQVRRMLTDSTFGGTLHPLRLSVASAPGSGEESTGTVSLSGFLGAARKRPDPRNTALLLTPDRAGSQLPRLLHVRLLVHERAGSSALRHPRCDGLRVSARAVSGRDAPWDSRSRLGAVGDLDVRQDLPGPAGQMGHGSPDGITTTTASSQRPRL